ncbi:AAA family ATPase [Candidatus Woesearchaeota archaeon]|nr:AAA family ATPase [Candidatus Woesearchaeota archaeon]
MKFYNREKEIETLKNLQKDFRIAVIGRRRIGKTRLIEHTFDCITLFVPAEKTQKEIIRNWRSEYPEFHFPSVNTFKEFFEFAFFHLKNKIIFIDELQNLAKVESSYLFDLQRQIDKYKPKLIITGSLISSMKTIVEEYKSPLYGRFDIIIRLNELDFQTINDVCTDLKISVEDTIKLYSVFGGIPKYYELIEKLKKFDFFDFILDSFITYPKPLYEEVRTMLKEEFGSEHKMYFSILSAISQGKNRYSQIAGFVGKKQTSISKYMTALKQDFELIKREIPITESKKTGIYTITNNIFLFWFKNVWRYSELLETQNEKKVKKLLRTNIKKHISFGFEKICRNLIKKNLIDLKYDAVGKQWGKFKGEKGKNIYEFDICAINKDKKEILFGECKWKDNCNPGKIFQELKDKAGYVEWNKSNRREKFVIFAKSFSKKIKKNNLILYDLNDMKQIL